METGHEPKNKITPHILKDFFSKEELEEILLIIENQKTDKTLDSFYAPFVLPQMSRMQIEVMYPKHIQDKLEKFASDITGEEVFMYHNSYLSYNLAHGDGENPKLPPHFDSDNYFSKLTLDYQLDKNIDWEIVIEEDSFNLEYGDLLVFWGAGKAHWREPVLFNDGDNTEVLTMHFSTKKDFEELNFVARQPDKREERLKLWNSDSEFSRYKDEYQKKEKLVRLKKELQNKLKNQPRIME